jgi:hypothetical protein
VIPRRSPTRDRCPVGCAVRPVIAGAHALRGGTHVAGARDPSDIPDVAEALATLPCGYRSYWIDFWGDCGIPRKHRNKAGLLRTKWRTTAAQKYVVCRDYAEHRRKARTPQYGPFSWVNPLAAKYACLQGLCVT